MGEFTEVLQLKVQELEDTIEEYEDSISRMKVKIETLNELLEESPELDPSPSKPGKVASKTKGRPKGSRNKKKSGISKDETDAVAVDDGRFVPTDAEQSELNGMEGTDPDLAKKLASRKFTPPPRPTTSYGPGVHPDPAEDYGQRPRSKASKNKSSNTPKSHANLTIEDED